MIPTTVSTGQRSEELIAIVRNSSSEQHWIVKPNNPIYVDLVFRNYRFSEITVPTPGCVDTRRVVSIYSRSWSPLQYCGKLWNRIFNFPDMIRGRDILSTSSTSFCRHTCTCTLSLCRLNDILCRLNFSKLLFWSLQKFYQLKKTLRFLIRTAHNSSFQLSLFSMVRHIRFGHGIPPNIHRSAKMASSQGPGGAPVPQELPLFHPRVFECPREANASYEPVVAIAATPPRRAT